MRERILQILEDYDNYLGTDDSGDAMHGIPSDEFMDVVQDIMEVIEEETGADINDADVDREGFPNLDLYDPYADLPSEVFLEDEPFRPQVKFGLRYVARR
jgi:hypothetical protein